MISTRIRPGALLTLAALASLPLHRPAAGQADPPKSPSAAAAQADFDKQNADWKDILKQLGELQSRYAKAPAGERPALEQQYRSIVEQGLAIEPKLKSAAEKLIAADPRSRSAGELLFMMAKSEMSRDNYEEALRLARVLLEQKFEPAAVATLAADAAVRANQFDRVAPLLNAAMDGKLDERATQMVANANQLLTQWDREKKLRQAEAKADDLPRVKLHTTQGDIVVELFENEAPNTVANFISLVEKKVYDGTPFHRVLPSFMAQGGDPQGDGEGGPGYRIKCECTRPDHRLNFRGTLSMAHSGPDTGGSQFFLNFVPNTHLDGKHTVFGRILEGMDVLAKIRRVVVEKGKPTPIPPDRILSATVLRKRSHEYKPETLPEIARPK